MGACGSCNSLKKNSESNIKIRISLNAKKLAK